MRRCNQCRDEKNYILSNLLVNDKKKTLCIDCAVGELFDHYKDKKEVVIIDNTEKQAKLGVIKWLTKKLD